MKKVVGTHQTEDINTVSDSKDDQSGCGDLTPHQNLANLRHSSGGSEDAYEYSTGKFTREFDFPQLLGCITIAIVQAWGLRDNSSLTLANPSLRPVLILAFIYMGMVDTLLVFHHKRPGLNQ
ncbi:WD-40 repeat family protein [Actinidia rufa]|uniref:WD-40 repeat family protein n=1 Tax=Actinidia rufa TaxID=165716 RepID=A0A7J0F153_9ERIC|nr:WD-40 repeat family protein [Actinidia rufa]